VSTARPPATKGAPPFAYLLFEGQRAVLEGLTTQALSPLLRRAPRGDGHSVLVLPGFTAGDRSTAVLRRTLRELGYNAHPWRMGQNLGMGHDLRERLRARVAELVERRDAKLSIVGWSLGGIYAREIAKAAPDLVRQVITLGSPFADINRANHARAIFDFFSRGQASRDEAAERRRESFAARLRLPPSVPTTAIFTKTDGVVHWRACLEQEGPFAENIEVSGSHCGLGMNSTVLFAVADRLSQPESAWQPFDRSGWRRLAYG
jgi:pimeloyl-ACP methyl ester carboxylesterase